MSRFTLRDLVTEAINGIGARPARTVLTIAGVVIGIGTLVTTLGVAATAGNQIAGRFDAVTATEVTVHVPRPSGMAWSATDDVARLDGVATVAAYSRTEEGRDLPVRANEVKDPTRILDRLLPVLGATPELPVAARADVALGRFFDAGRRPPRPGRGARCDRRRAARPGPGRQPAGRPRRREAVHGDRGPR
ncbi:ABC transporter permease [Actinoplanes sp. NPDC051851]|uniref:ABC transporter permease n=1 Tax=Actinoplanes sp. NPDC051851 TaxID=3154753 RepID=UPI003444D3C4